MSRARILVGILVILCLVGLVGCEDNPQTTASTHDAGTESQTDVIENQSEDVLNSTEVSTKKSSKVTHQEESENVIEKDSMVFKVTDVRECIPDYSVYSRGWSDKLIKEDTFSEKKEELKEIYTNYYENKYDKKGRDYKQKLLENKEYLNMNTCVNGEATSDTIIFNKRYNNANNVVMYDPKNEKIKNLQLRGTVSTSRDREIEKVSIYGMFSGTPEENIDNWVIFKINLEEHTTHTAAPDFKEICNNGCDFEVINKAENFFAFKMRNLIES